MTWLTLTYFITLGTLNQDISLFQKSDFLQVYLPKNTVEASIGMELLLAEHLFISGGVETYATPSSAVPYFNPSESLYTLGAGVRFGGFEIGMKHECDHITESSNREVISGGATGFAGTKTEFYLSFKGTMKIF